MARFGVLFGNRGLRPIGWGIAVLFVAALFVQLTHAGIDLFLMLAAGFVLLVLERTLGDWIAESVGAPGTVLIFALLAALAVTYAASADGRAKANRLFAVAESRGYRPVYFVVDGPATRRDAGRVGSAIADSAIGTSGNPTPAAAEKSDGQTPAANPTGDAPVSRSILDWSGSGPDKTIRLRLRADPDVIVTGQTVTLRATIESGVRKDPTVALFTVNGDVTAKVPFDASGNASTPFTAVVPGQYTARLRLLSGAIFGQEVSASFNVLPGARPRVRKSP
jgi:hypothetical protein